VCREALNLSDGGCGAHTLRDRCRPVADCGHCARLAHAWISGGGSATGQRRTSPPDAWRRRIQRLGGVPLSMTFCRLAMPYVTGSR
jgi:hypothetical protein